MFGYSVEQLLQALGYVGVLGMMVTNGVISIPSSQILYIVAGYFVGTGFFNFPIVALIGAIGNTIGNIVLYELARKHGEHYITKLFFLPAHQIKKVEGAFQRGGAWFVFVGKLLPAIKVFIPVAAGVGKMHRGTFWILVFVSSYIWACGFLAIGFFFGKSSEVFGAYATVLAIVTFFVLFVFYRFAWQQEE